MTDLEKQVGVPGYNVCVSDRLCPAEAVNSCSHIRPLLASSLPDDNEHDDDADDVIGGMTKWFWHSRLARIKRERKSINLAVCCLLGCDGVSILRMRASRLHSACHYRICYRLFIVK